MLALGALRAPRPALAPPAGTLLLVGAATVRNVLGQIIGRRRLRERHRWRRGRETERSDERDGNQCFHLASLRMSPPPRDIPLPRRRPGRGRARHGAFQLLNRTIFWRCSPRPSMPSVTTRSE